MRTTLNLDDDILDAAKAFAEHRSLPLGKAVTLLVRRGLAVRCPTRRANGLLIFDPPGKKPVTAELVNRLEHEEI